MGMVESGAGRAGRDAEDLRDLGWLVPGVVAQREDCALLWVETSEAAFELVSIRERQEIVVPRRYVDRQDAKVGHEPALAHRLVDGGPDDETVQPRVEPVRIAECGQIAPGDHQCFLHRILGPVDIAEDPLREREEPVTTRADQVGVCLPIPVLGRLDEIAIHGPIPSAPSGGAVRTTMGSRARLAFNRRPETVRAV